MHEINQNATLIIKNVTLRYNFIFNFDYKIPIAIF